MSFFGKLFGSEKALGRVIGTVKDGLDALYYSDEEKAHDQAAYKEARAQMALKVEEARVDAAIKIGNQTIEWMNATKGQNLARRFIAIGIFLAVVGSAILSALLNAVGAFWVERQENFAAAAESIHMIAGDFDIEMVTVMGFYFAPMLAGKFLEHQRMKNGN